MHNKKTTLTCIPEKSEFEGDTVKWVPKKKHEVLKAKYKCLQKLFQIYDASVIGMLPENHLDETYVEPSRRHRRKRSHRTKADACAGTTEISSGDVSVTATEDSAAPAVIRDLNLQQYCSTQVSKTTISKTTDRSDKSTQESKEDVSTSSDREVESATSGRIQTQNTLCHREMEYSHTIQTTPLHHIPCHVFSERRRPTRFQIFISRIFGLKPERRYSVPLTDHAYAVSDNNISNRYKKRKRRSLRFRRRRLRIVHSDVALGDLNSPLLLSYVQSVQRNCLKDATPRQCPIVGCRMLCYGIINYNDHLNLCHFPDRKYFCHYCHEGFLSEHDTIVHENGHIGITKIAANLPPSPIMARPDKAASNTQTDPEPSKCDVPEEKLKKIVSFFDKISDPDQVFDHMKQKIHSESNLQSFQQSSKSYTTGTETKSSNSEKGASSCVEVQKNGGRCTSTADSGATSNIACDHRVICRFCGEKFDFRRQLSLHVDLEHRVHDKFSKFHSCPGIVSARPRQAGTAEVTLEDGRINVQSIGPVSSTYTDISGRKSDVRNATSVDWYTSVESVGKKPSVVGSFVQKIRSYKWEPGSKIIHI